LPPCNPTSGCELKRIIQAHRGNADSKRLDAIPEFGVILSPKPSRQCNGVFHNVYLGHVFSTDLLLLRMTVAQPMATDTNNLVVLRALEDALYSIAEALRLAASRHPQLDLDPSEFGAGFRIVPSGNADGQLFLDIYLYDTLSGGAGYAELAGRYLDDILRDVLKLLENCPAHCDRSCESCLCHYHNHRSKAPPRGLESETTRRHAKGNWRRDCQSRG